MTDSLIENFTEAWEQVEGDDFASRLARRSLAASAEGHPALEHTLQELQKPAQERLKLRITGVGVKGRSAPAEALAKLYADINTATTAIAKRLSGKGRWQPNLLATAASPGSLRVQFAAPDAPRTQTPLRGTEIPGLEAQALRTIANVIAQAEGEDETLLLASTSKLPAKARSAINRLAQTASSAQWDIESLLEGRGRGTVSTRLTAASARRLIRATEAVSVESDPLELSGTADGWRWSTGSLVFAPDHGKPFSAAVPPHLQLDVANLMAKPDARLQARFLRVRTHPTGSEQVVSTTYSLERIEEVGD